MMNKEKAIFIRRILPKFRVKRPICVAIIIEEIEDNDAIIPILEKISQTFGLREMEDR